MDLEGAFFDLEGALLHSLPKSGGAMPPWLPGSYVPVTMNILTGMIIHNCSNYLSYGKQSCFIGLFKDDVMNERG